MDFENLFPGFEQKYHVLAKIGLYQNKTASILVFRVLNIFGLYTQRVKLPQWPDK